MYSCSSVMTDTESQKSPPGPKSDPTFGNFPELDEFGNKKETFKLLKSIATEYGNVVKIDLVIFDVVLLSGEEAIFEAFYKKDLLLVDRPAILANVNNRGTGAILQNGRGWREMRTTALVALTSSKSGSEFHERIILGETRDLIEDIKKEPQFHPRDTLQDAVCNIQIGVLFGKRLSHANPRFLKLVDAIRRIYVYEDGTLIYAGFPVLRFDSADKPFVTHKEAYLELYDALEVEQKKADPKCTESVYSIFKSEAEKDPDSTIYTHKNITSSMADMFIPCGIVSTIVEWAIRFMIEYPDVQHKCQEEVDDVCQSGMVTMKHLKKLSYTQATLLEVKRISGLFQATLPHAAERDITLQGFHIPKGTLVVGFLDSVNTDNTIWDKPEQFKPGRFLDQSGTISEKRRRLQFFGIGVRRCPGEVETDLIASLVFSNLLKTFTFSKIDGVRYSLDREMDIAVRPVPYKVNAKLR